MIEKPRRTITLELEGQKYNYEPFFGGSEGEKGYATYTPEGEEKSKSVMIYQGPTEKITERFNKIERLREKGYGEWLPEYAKLINEGDKSYLVVPDLRNGGVVLDIEDFGQLRLPSMVYESAKVLYKEKDKEGAGEVIDERLHNSIDRLQKKLKEDKITANTDVLFIAIYKEDDTYVRKPYLGDVGSGLTFDVDEEKLSNHFNGWWDVVEMCYYTEPNYDNF